MQLISFKPIRVFLLIGLLFSVCTQAQSPGNTKGCEIWLTNASAAPVSGKATVQSKLTADLNFNKAIVFSDSLLTQIDQIALKKRFTIFVVYKSNTEEQPLFQIKNKNGSVKFTSKKIISSNKVEYNEGNPKEGIIVSYLTSLDKKGRNSLRFLAENLNASGELKSSILEFIYYPRFLNSLERQKIETYLSLKYGVSLSGGKDYISPKGDTLWNAKKNKEYAKRVTGLGRNDATALYQKQSGNSQKDGLYIASGDSLYTLNTLNRAALTDDSYLIWADNDQPTLLQEDKDGTPEFFTMKRIWKVDSKLAFESLATSVYINSKEMTLIDKKADTLTAKTLPYWLVADHSEGGEFDYFNADYTKEFKADPKGVLFKDIKWTGTSSTKFTVVKAPNLFFDYEVRTVCETKDRGTVQLKIRGGMAPFSVTLLQGNTVFKTLTVSSKTADVSDLPQGNYTLRVADSKKESYERALSIRFFESLQASLAPQWYLEGKSNVLIQPVVYSADAVRFSWMYNGTVISEDKEFKASQAGNYVLVLKNEEGCEKELAFTVSDKPIYEGWVLYPNPSHAGDKFSIAFNYKEAAPISLKITDLSGRVIRNKELGTITTYLYTDAIAISGTYIVLITKGNTTETTKLIIE